MEHVIAGYLRQVWEFCGWLDEGHHDFRPGYSYESQVVTVCQDIADSLDDGVRTNAIIIDFSKALDLIPHVRLFTKIEATEMDFKVVVWVQKFLLGRSQRVRVEGQLSEKVRVTSGAPQASVLGPLLFLAYVNDVWRNTDSNIRPFADDFIIYRKIIGSSDIDKLQMDLNRLGEWAVENEMKINPGIRKAISFTKARANEQILTYLLHGAESFLRSKLVLQLVKKFPAF